VFSEAQRPPNRPPGQKSRTKAIHGLDRPESLYPSIEDISPTGSVALTW
jgi:hypothetical protein